MASTSNRKDESLVGKRALVTGGTRGIGIAIATRLLASAASVIITARTADTALFGVSR